MPEPDIHSESTGPVPLAARPPRSWTERLKLWHLILGISVALVGGAVGLVKFGWNVRGQLETKAPTASLAETQKIVEQHGRDITQLQESSRDEKDWRRSLDGKIDWLVRTYYERLPPRAKEVVEPPPVPAPKR